jgi:LacI family transcriptional regulator
MNRPHLVTIKDIAKDLKISIATVSRALRNTYDVSEETKNKVLAKSKELNYRPNFNARGLVNHKSHNIAVILPTITNYYFSTVITGIQNVAYKNDFNVILYVTGESPEREINIARQLSLSSIDGLLVCVTSESHECDHLKEIIDNGVPIVFFDRVSESIAGSKVMQNDFEGAFVAVEHLIKNGYRKIAHIGGPQGLSFSINRLNGYISAIKKYNLPVFPEWVIQSEFTQQSGASDTEELWKGRNKPDAIFAVNDRKAIGAMLELKKRNVKVGKEVGVVGFTNDPMSAIISPSLTTFEEPALEIGMKCCELLLKHISKKSFLPREVILQGKLIVRESSGKLKR